MRPNVRKAGYAFLPSHDSSLRPQFQSICGTAQNDARSNAGERHTHCTPQVGRVSHMLGGLVSESSCFLENKSRCTIASEQDNGYDCGLFLLVFVEFFCHGAPEHLTVPLLKEQGARAPAGPSASHLIRYGGNASYAAPGGFPKTLVGRLSHVGQRRSDFMPVLWTRVWPTLRPVWVPVWVLLGLARTRGHLFARSLPISCNGP
jgi:hypothetical protein